MDEPAGMLEPQGRPMTPTGASPTAFRRLLALSVALPAALLAVLTLVLLGQIRYLLSATEAVDHTDRVIAGANRLLGLLVDGETGLRGYLVTGEPDFLEPYHRMEADAGPAFAGMVALVSDNPPQAERLQGLESALADWRAYARALIDLRRRGGDYADPTRNHEGKEKMDVMRAQVAAFVGVEEQLREARNQAVHGMARVVVESGVGLALVLGAALAYFIRRQMARVTADYREALERASRLAAIVESSDDAIFGKTLDGMIVTWNAGAERLYGYAAAEAEGRPVAILVPPDREGEWEAILARIRKGERVDHFETVRVRKDGRHVDVSLTVSPVKDSSGRLVGASAVARDISRQKRAEEEARAMTQQLWQAAKLASVGELAASIAHELNNPLATVSLRVEAALGQTPDGDPRRRPLEVVEQEVERMGELVSGLLQFSRRGEGQISTVDVRDELARAVDLVAHLLRRRSVTVAWELAPDTPIVYADRQKLRQVLLNLVTNASDAMPRGGTLTLRTAPAALPDGQPAVAIEVADTGEGIPQENLAKIFEPFFTTKEEGKGTGLGLPICRRVVEEHHGSLHVASEVGIGTTVRIVIPVRNGTNVDHLIGADPAG